MVGFIERFGIILLGIVALVAVTGCSSGSPQSLTLADASHDAKYEHLYEAMEHDGYKNPAFGWMAPPK